MSNPISRSELIDFWQDEVCSEDECSFMEKRTLTVGFSEDVPNEVVSNMKEWANAEPGDSACKYAKKVKKLLGI